MVNFKSIDVRFQELIECPRCHCEIQQGADCCIRCGLILVPVVVCMMEKHQRNDGHLHDRNVR